MTNPNNLTAKPGALLLLSADEVAVKAANSSIAKLGLLKRFACAVPVGDAASEPGMAPVSDEAGVFTNRSGIYSGLQVNRDVYLKAHSGSPFPVVLRPEVNE